MSTDANAVPDPLSGWDVRKYVGSPAPFLANAKIYEDNFVVAGRRQSSDYQIVDLAAERLRRRIQELQQLDDQGLQQFPLLQVWFALAHSDISPHNFSRLQNAAIELEGRADHEAAKTFSTSTRLFLTFWDDVRQGNQEPELHVGTNGRLQALWSHPDGWFLVVEFGSDDKAFWAIYQDEDIIEGQQSAATIGQLAKNLRALASKPLRWHC